MDIKNIPYLDELEEIGLEKEDYIIWGSAPLIIRGIKEKNKDLDILVNKHIWNKLIKKYTPEVRQIGNVQNVFIVIGNIDITYRVVGIWEDNLEELYQNADIIDGYQFFSLGDTIEWKSKTGREKDLNDLKLIKEYKTKNNI